MTETENVRQLRDEWLDAERRLNYALPPEPPAGDYSGLAQYGEDSGIPALLAEVRAKSAAYLAAVRKPASG